MSDPRAWLEERQALAAAATDKPWEAGDGWVYTRPIYDDDRRLSNVLGMRYADPDRAEQERARAQRNVEFIADARQSVPAMAAALTAVLDEIGPHYEAAMRPARKWGRDRPDCVCPICKAMPKVEAALGGEGA